MKFLSYYAKLVCLLIIPLSSNAQPDKLLAHIPNENTSAVAYLPAQSIQYIFDSSRIQVASAFVLLQNYIGQEKPNDLFNEIASFTDFKSAGLDVDNGVLLWLYQSQGSKDNVGPNESDTYIINMVIPTYDIDNLRSFLDSLIPTSLVRRTMPGSNSLQCFYNGFMFNWNKDRLIISSFASSDNEASNSLESNSQLINYANQFYNPKKWVSVDQHPNFQYNSKNSYFSVWVNNNQWAIDYKSFPKELSFMLDGLKKQYLDRQLFSEYLVDDHKLSLRTRFYWNKDAFPSQTRSVPSPNQKKIQKFIKGSTNIFFSQFSVDIESYLTEQYSSFSTLLKSEPMGEIMDQFLDLFAIFIDEEDIFDLWKGHFSLSVYDLAMRNIAYTDYKYNEQTDDYDEVIGYKNRLIPMITMLADYGNEANTSAILSVVERLGLIRKIDEERFDIPELEGNELGSLYIRKTKGIVMLSNDSTLIFSNKPFKKKDQFSKKQWENMLDHTFYTKLDIINLIKSLDSFWNSLGAGDLSSMLSPIKNTLNAIQITQKRADNICTESELSITLNSDNKMAINDLQNTLIQMIGAFMTKEKEPVIEDEFRF